MIGESIIAGALGIGGRIVGAVWPLIVKAAPWILLAVAGAVIWHHVPRIGPAARINAITIEASAAKESARKWREHAQGWESVFRKAEALRSKETQAAGDAVAAQAQQCRAEVAAARASARVIERIVTRESSYDANRCPIRSTVDAGSLREALAPRSADPD